LRESMAKNNDKILTFFSFGMGLFLATFGIPCA
jgi:hypothetical protein